MTIAIASISQNFITTLGGDEILAVGTLPQNTPIAVQFVAQGGATYPCVSGRAGSAKTLYALNANLYVYTPALPVSVTQGNLQFMELSTTYPDGYPMPPPYTGEGPLPNYANYVAPPTFNGYYVASSVLVPVAVVPPLYTSCTFDLRTSLPSTAAAGARSLAQVSTVGY